MTTKIAPRYQSKRLRRSADSSSGSVSGTAAVLGGIGNLTGAMLGGLFLGILSALSDGYIGARWTPVVVFGLLIVVLVFRPSGLLGQQTSQRA